MSQGFTYPWYSIVHGDELAQGDLLFGCPRFVIPAKADDAENIELTCESVGLPADIPPFGKSK